MNRTTTKRPAPPSIYQRNVLELKQRLVMQADELTGYRDHMAQLPLTFDEKITALNIARDELIRALEVEYHRNWK